MPTEQKTVVRNNQSRKLKEYMFIENSVLIDLHLRQIYIAVVGVLALWLSVPQKNSSEKKM